MAKRPLFLGSDIYRTSRYASDHPLAIPRVSTTIDLCRAMGWLSDDAYRDTPMATPEQLVRFHDPAYVAALMRAEAEQRVDEETARRHDIGRRGNPLFPDMFRRPATGAGATLLAARLLLEGTATVYSPAGGTHHGRPDRASGFCFLNDPVLGILALLDGGVGRVLYVDLDAHHGDGVEAAFAGDPRVLTVSVHEEGRWPFTGRVGDRAGGSARNLPVPAGFNDRELAHLVDAALLPLGRAFAPEVLVLQCGADALADDPLSRLELSNGALWAAVAALSGLAPRRLVLGGGGYNPWSVARCWAGVWATLDGRDPAVPPTPAAEALLRSLTWTRAAGRNPPERWFTTLADPPRDGPLRDAVRQVAAAALAPG
ncbi:acetoin utilization protein AcuC [Azospirillum sp. A39]|uniref:acetoin utilization protein AcuC n=1 Tax=Azospirillum sp. A39 TaxID=3462279 RepID=UPI004045B001